MVILTWNKDLVIFSVLIFYQYYIQIFLSLSIRNYERIINRMFFSLNPKVIILNPLTILI